MSDDETMLKPVQGHGTWENWHETVKGEIEGIDKVFYPPDRPPYGSDAINRCTRQIQRSIASAKVRRIAHRGVGRGWSLSEAALTDGIMLDTSVLTGKKRIRANQVDPGYKGSAEQRDGLCLIQCGNYISEINEWLEDNSNGLALHTSGAANGQTVIGASSAGTHGSALDFGAFHDQIVAIHLLAGEDKQFWIERESYPVMKPSLPASINAELLRDDDSFNAVVMGLGAFGIIHNVVIEARPRKLFDAYNYATDRNGATLVLDEAMRKRIGKLDFTSDTRLDPDGASGKPYFFQPIINPNSSPPEVMITQMHEKHWRAGYVPEYRLKQGKFGPGFDFVSVAARALDLFQNLVPLFSKLVAADMFELGKTEGCWGELFGYKARRAKVASGSVAVPQDHALAALDTLLDLNADIGPVPVVFGCRYIRKSPALLAFNRWDTTVMINVDGVFNDDTKEFLEKIPERMEVNGIPFTQHWGKINHYTRERVRHTYGNDLDTWLRVRSELLPSSADRELFENAFMRRCGLDL